MAQAFQTIGKCSQSTFRSVTELSSGGDRLSGFAAVDVVNLVEFPFNYIISKNFLLTILHLFYQDKALKGMAAHESSVTTGLPAYSFERCRDLTSTGSGNFCLPGAKVPLDFTLKTSMRVVSSSPVNWLVYS